MNPETLRKTLFALGLCRKAGKGIFGTDAVVDAMRAQRSVALVVMPCDNSENTRKKLTDKCNFYRVELLEIPVSGEILAHAVGRTGHSAAVGILDESFAQLIRKTLQEE